MSEGCFVVTGASSGIGAVVARRLIARGENVLAVARRADRLRALCCDVLHARFVAIDLAEADVVAAVSRAVKESFGAVRGFVHCAGFNRLAPLSLVDAAVAQRLYAVHTLFPMRFMGWLGKAPNHVEGAACVLVSSMACHEGAAGNVAYAAAKGGIEGMLKAAAAELVVRGVRVNAVAPGFVKTEMARETCASLLATPEKVAEMEGTYPLGFGTPEQIADVIDFFLSERSAWITGQCLAVDGGHGLV
ncbi:MAG: SDR family NAD(P)-dependent oxidoreductase [Kiritimatiellia bacterium]